MRELRLLCFDYDYKIKWLKKMLPNLQIESHSGNITIAIPFSDNYGFWEITVKQLRVSKFKAVDTTV